MKLHDGSFGYAEIVTIKVRFYTLGLFVYHLRDGAFESLKEQSMNGIENVFLCCNL